MIVAATMRFLLAILCLIAICSGSEPSSHPSSQPSSQPSRRPSRQPTSQPSRLPSSQPSRRPSSQPSSQPSSVPSQPSLVPSNIPSSQPSQRPSTPTGQPTQRPSTPTGQPTSRPTTPSGQPTSVPTHTPAPTESPTVEPTVHPTKAPTFRPSRYPTRAPTKKPALAPTAKPSAETGVVLEFTSTLTVSSFAADSLSTDDKNCLRNATAASAKVLYSEVTWYSGGDISLERSAGLRQQLTVETVSKTLVATLLTRVSLTFYPEYSSATALYEALTANVNSAQSSGAFTAYLRSAAIYYNTTALKAATVASISNSEATISGETIDGLVDVIDWVAVIAAIAAFVVVCITCSAIVYWQLKRWRHADMVLEMEEDLHSPEGVGSGGRVAKKKKTKTKVRDGADYSEHSSPIHEPVKDWWENVTPTNDFSSSSSGGDIGKKANKAKKVGAPKKKETPSAVEMPPQQSSLGGGGKIVIDRSKFSQAVGKTKGGPSASPFKAFEGNDSLL